MATSMDETVIGALALDALGGSSFEPAAAVIRDHQLDLRFWIPDNPPLFGVVIPLPESTGAMPFLYMPPADEADFLQMLRLWIDEEVQTGCPIWAMQTEVDGVRYFEVANYGFRHANEAEHTRLTAAATGTWDYADVADELRRGRN